MSTQQTYVSHFSNAARSANEASEMFGKPVANLAEAASAIVAHPSFDQCTTRWVLAHYLRLKDTTFHAIPHPLLETISTGAQAANPNPTLGDLIVAALSNPIVIESYVLHGKKGDLQ